MQWQGENNNLWNNINPKTHWKEAGNNYALLHSIRPRLLQARIGGRHISLQIVVVKLIYGDLRRCTAIWGGFI